MLHVKKRPQKVAQHRVKKRRQKVAKRASARVRARILGESTSLPVTIHLQSHQGEIIHVSVTAPGVDFRKLRGSVLDRVSDEARQTMLAAGLRPPRFLSAPRVIPGDPSSLELADA